MHLTGIDHPLDSGPASLSEKIVSFGNVVPSFDTFRSTFKIEGHRGN